MCIDRREFIKLLTTSLIAWQLELKGKGITLSQAEANTLGLLDLINWDCISCELDGFCFNPPKPPTPAVKYWVPAGFMETGRRGEIGRSSDALAVIGDLVKPVINDILNFIPEGSFLNETHTGKTSSNMYLYPHYFGFPKSIEDTLASTFGTASSKNPTCLCATLGYIFNLFGFNPTQQLSVFRDIAQRLDDVKSRLISSLGNSAGNQVFSNIQNTLDKVNQIADRIKSISNNLPNFALAELIYPVWIIDTLSPDAYTIAPLFTAIRDAITQKNMVAGAIACPYLTEYLGSKIQLPSGIDPSFICVGFWGYGYPRIGIVKHPDPILAGLLSIARFHHLASTTIPVIRPVYDNASIKYQMYNPNKTNCFYPGWYGVPALSPEDITKLISDPARYFKDLFGNINTNSVLDEAKSVGIQGLKASKPNYRNIGVVVWSKVKKCCW
jgi:hypothetical protein